MKEVKKSGETPLFFALEGRREKGGRFFGEGKLTAVRMSDEAAMLRQML